MQAPAPGESALTRGLLQARVLGAGAIAYAGVIGVALSPWPQLIGLASLGVNPVWSALGARPRRVLMMIVVLALGSAGATATAFTGRWQPLLGVLLVCALAVYSTRLVDVGIHQAGAFVLMLTAYVMLDPGHIVAHLGATMPRWQLLVVMGLVPAGCASWAAVSALVLTGGRLPRPRPAVQDLPYGLLLGAICSALLVLCLLFLPGTQAWWTILTVVCILRPSRAETRTRERYRVYGTLLGGAAAAVIGWLVPYQPVWIALGMVAILMGTIVNLDGGAYWKWSTMITFAVVLLTFSPHTVLGGDVVRVGATLIATAVTVSVILLLDRWSAHRAG